MVAAQRQHDEIAVLTFHDQRLQAALRRNGEEGAQLGDAVNVRRVDASHRLARRRPFAVRRRAGNQLQVDGELAARGEGDGVLARVREHVELVRTAAADGAGIGLDDAEHQPGAGENARVGLVHGVVAALVRVTIQVERVSVLHDELARTHDTETGPNLVAELGLYLVEIGG